MPELPEVETTLRGITPHILNREITGVAVRQPRLRWPVPRGLKRSLTGSHILATERRGKYLLLRTDNGTLIIHLGMSGSLRILPCTTPPQPHDHVDIEFGSLCLRLRDPRRFGAVLFTRNDPYLEPQLRNLGPEPLTGSFNGHYLHTQARGRRGAVKNLIMNAAVVVGVGNIYANESLFRSGIHPGRACNRISEKRYLKLADEIKRVLAAAIEQGGTTLKDFQHEDGKPGYFAQELQVYGKAGAPCPKCGTTLQLSTIGQRSTFFCNNCQT
jgi:formamidopyrimidine-DNA glycosylase